MRLELTLEDLGAQGDGIAHLDGRAIFVAGGLAGERVVVEREGDAPHATLLAITRPSASRAAPACPHFLRCGGCRLQHLEPQAYLSWKIEQLRQALLREGLTDLPLLPPFVAAPATRRRARLAAQRKGETVTLGFNAWRSHTLVDVTACAVLLPEIMAFLPALREKLPLWLPSGMACDVQLTALAGGLDVVLVGGPALGLEARMDLAMIAESLDIAKLSWRKWDRSPVEPIAHRKPLSVRYGALDVPFPPASFLQATAASEQALLAFAANAVGDSGKVLDLFCGLGGFGLSLPKARHVRCADLDGPAMQALDRAIKGHPRYAAQQRNLIGDPFAAAECDAFDAVIFDPPRGGAKAQAAQLAQSRMPHIVAVSCDPPSFARDAKILLQGGYHLRALLPVDQFLWSTHMELAAHFAR